MQTNKTPLAEQRIPADAFGAAERSRWGEIPCLSMFFSLALIASVAHAEVDPLADLIKGQPRDVAAVTERIAMCTHFGGEEPYDKERRREIVAAMKKYRCAKIEDDRTALNKRYKNNAAVLGVLQKAHEW